MLSSQRPTTVLQHDNFILSFQDFAGKNPSICNFAQNPSNGPDCERRNAAIFYRMTDPVCTRHTHPVPSDRHPLACIKSISSTIQPPTRTFPTQRDRFMSACPFLPADRGHQSHHSLNIEFLQPAFLTTSNQSYLTNEVIRHVSSITWSYHLALTLQDKWKIGCFLKASEVLHIS